MDTNDERKFLHDIATPLGAAMFGLDAAISSLQSCRGISPDHLLELSNVYQILVDLGTRLQKRREVLVQQGAPSSSGG